MPVNSLWLLEELRDFQLLRAVQCYHSNALTSDTILYKPLDEEHHKSSFSVVIEAVSLLACFMAIGDIIETQRGQTVLFKQPVKNWIMEAFDNK